jgi:glycosyltransferase involved in cell wall biosynthesis
MDGRRALGSVSSSPIVSVCIPAYRGAAHIGAAIESVLTQTFGDFELVVIDDNSPDDTRAVVERYGDPRIRLMRNARNLGPEGNWNRCLEEARGTYIKLLPQDDVLSPDCLARQVTVLERDTEGCLALVFCARKIIDAQGRALMTRGLPRGKAGTVAARALVKSCLRHGTNVIGEPGGVLFRAVAAREVGSFDATDPYLIDLDYWFRLLLKGDANYIPERLVAFRISSESWSVAIGARQRADFCHFVDRVAAQPEYRVNWLEALNSRVMAWVNSVSRLVIYSLVLGNDRKRAGSPPPSQTDSVHGATGWR